MKATVPTEATAPTATGPWLENAWDPKTGRGVVTHHQPGEGTLTAGFHVGYPGYTGGLVMGGYSSSGLAWVPERPKRGFASINVFCAQDESIWDRDQRHEYSYGWSENFGTGPDGERLSYVWGRVLESTRERVALMSENRGGCYQVRKIATTWASARFWILATRITNRCDHTVHFHFFSGDDPWIGTYKSSDGDVGWTPHGFVRNETRFEPGGFTAGGLVDLGNEQLGQREGSFSNEADFFALDPTLPLPEAAFANRFAHGPSEIDPKRPLDNQSMTALNLGWLGRELKPGASMDVAFALGLAVPGDTHSTPKLPRLTDEHWSRWRNFLEPKPGAVRDNAEFAAELVELGVFPKRLEVHGTYYVVNPTSASVAFTIGFPIAVAPDRPPPQAVMVDGREVPVAPESPKRVSASFVISIPPLSVRSFDVAYTQPHSGRRAEYIVTSALSWKRPLRRAVFRITAAAQLGPVRASYPAKAVRDDQGRSVLTIVRQPFVPDREMTVTW
ncbi:MAG: hypothetical protein JW940_22500 [Polyangiaceae bacterium]|nr:hypothetical protein [Polyangiaceae bacterium]